MSSLYQSLSTQVAATLREEVRAGSWKKILPGERQLAERLNVSRKTVRKALALLRGEGFIQTERNRPSALLRTGAKSAKKPSPKIALLLPEPIEGARPFTVLWVNHLMALLQESGMQLEVVSGWKYFGTHASRSLRQLIDAHPDRCWILARSHRALQQWFASNQVRAVIAGSAHAGIPLPSVDIDHRALCRHAAQTFLRQGHRRLALFLEKAGHAGDDESEKAFREALASHPNTEPPLICRPNRGPASVIRELRRLQALPSPPTGYLLSNSFSYLTVFSHLAQQGERVPSDVSLISRDEEPFLSHLEPIPTRYSIRPAKFSAALHHAIKSALTRAKPEHSDIRIMPDFIKGGSVASPA
jgi:DNA-binding LacI/PurR family transcriptional regulator